MKTSHLPRIAAALLGFGLTNFVWASSDQDSVVTAVFTRSFNDYARPARADGSDQPLTYVVAKGGAEAGMYGDDSMDDVKFAGIVRVLGKYLAKQSYYPAKDAKKADLMLVVHWGKTVPFSDGFNRSLVDKGFQGMESLQRLQMGSLGRSAVFDPAGSSVAPESAGTASTSQANEAAVKEAATQEMVQGLMEIRFAEDARIEANRRTANLLGYTAELRYRDNPSLFGGAGTAYYDLIDDLEFERYYIVVTAYDFQEALQHKNKKGLWRTVASIDARGNRFDERLAGMLEKASKYFGRDTGRLIRQFDYTPKINLGELKSLGVVDKAPAAKQ